MYNITTYLNIGVLSVNFPQYEITGKINAVVPENTITILLMLLC